MNKVKADYEDKLVEGIPDNPKRFFNYCRHFTKSSSTVTVLENDGVKLTDDYDKAEYLNEFFASVLTRETDIDCLPRLDVKTGSRLYDMEIMPDMVKSKTKEVKTK